MAPAECLNKDFKDLCINNIDTSLINLHERQRIGVFSGFVRNLTQICLQQQILQ